MLNGILVPGGTGRIVTLHDLAWEVLADRTAHVEDISWVTPRGILDDDAIAEKFVRGQVEEALERAAEVAPRGRPVLVAKSFGSYAAALAAERSLPAVWLTPLLTRAPIVDAITRNPAPQLLVGGTEDSKWWDADAARGTGKQVLTVPGGTHSLRVPGPIRNYTTVLGDVATAIEEFLDALD